MANGRSNIKLIAKIYIAGKPNDFIIIDFKSARRLTDRFILKEIKDGIKYG